MLCEQCRMREASIVIREVVNGTVTERNLCSECASQSDLGGILMDSSSPFAKTFVRNPWNQRFQTQRGGGRI